MIQHESSSLHKNMQYGIEQVEEIFASKVFNSFQFIKVY